MRTSYEKNKLVMSRGNWESSHQWECWDLGERNQEFPLGENSFSTLFSRSLAGFPSPCFNAHVEVSNEWWKRQISNKNPFICKNVFTLAWGGFWLVPKRVNASNGRWKCILWIHSSKRIKKKHVTLRYETGSRSTASEMLFWSFWNAWASLSSKYLCIIVLHNGVPKQQHSPTKAMKVIFHIWKLLYSVAYPSFQYQFTRKWLFCSLWLVGWKRCLFVNVLCDIPILRIS